MRVFGSPHRYYQGPGVFDELGPIIAPFGPRPLIVVDALMLEALRDRLEATLGRASVTAIVKPFSGEITYAAIDDLIAELGGAVPTAAVGIGGGKSLDAAKAVALKLGLPVVTVPTIASNDSPTSSVIAMYDASHSLISVDKMPRSPEAVVVDTAIIARAPARLLRAGIGDAVAKKFEAEGCLRGTGKTPFGTRPLHTAMVIADACYQTLRAHAVDALAAVERQRVDDALERVVEATILMSGLGFENGGLSLAHSMTRGLVNARGARDAIHGDQVAYGLLVQLAFENRPDDFLRDLLGFYRAIGLPSSLTRLGMDRPTDEEVAEIARLTMTAPHLANVTPTATESGIGEAVRRVERLAA
ncbi:glycerol dehydrogenase [Roseiarcus fermentans]|uniref:Glycerol dehydrogenase n=1 Tax=Roseiarcus fermentans TaxID=1473586 RepID=A0A366EZL6_9HYPH|nr:glycerol dehydrogenase [Roseiarcus fermentans]RBP07316.1 glycerol dehydrogenase [Roseiarcus fermentans]